MRRNVSKCGGTSQDKGEAFARIQVEGEVGRCGQGGFFFKKKKPFLRKYDGEKISMAPAHETRVGREEKKIVAKEKC